MAELTNEKAIEHYTELMRRIQVGAYVELEHDGSYPPDDGTPESGTLESIDNLEKWAHKQGLAFHWYKEENIYKLEPMSDEEKAARRVADYNRAIDERNAIAAANREKPWLPLHDGE